MSSSWNGARSLLSTAHALGVRVCFANPGTTELGLVRALDDEHVIEHVAKLAPYFQSAMRAAVGNHPLVGEIRGRGLLIGIELVKDRATKAAFPRESLVGRRLLRSLLQRGLISRALGDTMVFSPPLIITHEQVDELVGIFKTGLEAFAQSEL